MKLEVFKKIIETIEHQVEASLKMVEYGIDILSYDEIWLDVISLSLSAYYGQEGGEWIGWYLFERTVDSEVLKAYDTAGNEICFDIPSLWKHLEELRVSESFKEYELLPDEPLTDKDILNLFSEKR